jgi:hypothetical protein
MKLPLALTVILIVLLLAGCSSAAETPAPAYPGPGQPVEATQPQSPAETPTVKPMNPFPGTDPYAGPLSQAPAQPTVELVYEAYPEPISGPTATFTPALPVVIPTPGDDLGVVTGMLLSSDTGNPPYLATLYLGNTINPDKEGFPPMVTLSEATDPKAVQDESGTFVFSAIKPGFYAILVWDPTVSKVIMDEKDENYFVFEVKAGELTDLGVIYYP